jgi:hypothetical protein
MSNFHHLLYYFSKRFDNGVLRIGVLGDAFQLFFFVVHYSSLHYADCSFVVDA